ncbi:hypothetical protein A3K29_05515 [Candidatus Collierbacteria bacterium RIFOXYB2_FULL_46_14]|uniref:Uncharacterized protein n=1 Tax=Candidatus Collierbacteria bacterium GW2011_GWA2_46_26 TaxID=1618381 RepID=A0A0G1RTS1_9BACT|nr:MAG: hypothetical protein UX47_C0004G0013 [Candidatus Collierbacteria bacterium GW2011_GWA2_46_26]OGD73549.1 MAG: hypothetical protein A3K29_05515 [Candidatus Collierbacteria bacterium RIFOXYB2_FULL_46_14]OGD76591.1 MAG: hypothetical protein A3K43_05515 [Candidatus Collierbacteria bacterium RIFOXYA2_FULL_46_20]OGD77927.1 MAG: hypothetical protein A3K39_05515 [Candidatus Collierbacteria bacterium RIFOXYC2_FULL_43_15]OGD81218.1 MAG: hypothetical protein A2320_06015 [Pseudomonadales bacterium G
MNLTLFILGFTALAMVAGLIYEMMNGRDHSLRATLTITGILALIINWVAIWLITVPFTHFMTGYLLMVYINLIIPIIASAIAGASNETMNGAITGIVVVVLLFVSTGIVVPMSTTPRWCDDAGISEKIGLLKLEPAPEGMLYHETALDQLIKVPASAALTKAGNELSGGENVALGNYLQPNQAYLTRVRGIPTYVIDLKVTQALGFRNAGRVVPGYLLVNAVDPNAPVEFRRGYQLRYVPSGMFSLDLDRRAYFQFELGANARLEDLDGMEVDDTLYPTYTGTIMSHVLSYKSVAPTGVYHFDPATGQGEVVALADIPTKLPHLDRVYPLDWVKDQVTLWGKFANHESCTLNQNGQVQIDNADDVITPEGIEYQITMTGMGNDPSMTQLIAVNPTTGHGYIFPLTGKSVESIRDAYGRLTKQIYNQELKVDECELHAIDGEHVVYCIFTSSDAYGNTNVSGYGFVGLNRAENDADYAVGKTFEDAYQEYRKIRDTAQEEINLTNTAHDVTIIGTVSSNEWVSDESGGSRLISLVEDGTNVSYWLLADGTSKNAAAAQPGHHVTVTAYQRNGQPYLSVRYITVDGVPDFGGSLYWHNFIEWLKSW